MVKEYTNVEVSEHSFTVVEDNHGTPYPRHFTRVIVRQTWDETAGIYAGKEYRLEYLYVSHAPGHRGQLLSRSSAPWD